MTDDPPEDPTATVPSGAAVPSVQPRSIEDVPRRPSIDEEPTRQQFFGDRLRDELIRAALAIFFTIIFAATIVLSFVHVGGASWNNTKDWLQILVPAETALLGSATGFYFGQRKSGDS